MIGEFPVRKSPLNSDPAALEELASISQLPVKTSTYYDGDNNNTTVDPDREKREVGKVRDFFSVEQMKQLKDCLYEGEVPSQVEVYGRLIRKSSTDYIGEMTIHLRLTNGRPVQLYENKAYNTTTRGATCIEEVLVPLDDLHFTKPQISLDEK